MDKVKSARRDLLCVCSIYVQLRWGDENPASNGIRFRVPGLSLPLFQAGNEVT
jgi:hypothetical protein